MATLYVVATPIGNLQDLSPRGAETLRNADLIIAEDTRVTMKLCQVFSLKAPLVSCHRHNEEGKAGQLARKILEEDLNAALVTDAGTPCISDPGCETAREKKDLKEKLREIARGAKVAVAHESPFRITDLAEAIAETLPQAKLAVCCDLTKLHEKTLYGTPEEVLSALRANEKTEKGEYCVVMDLHGVPAEEKEPEAAEWPMEARIIEEMKKGLGLREAQEALIARGEKKNAVKQAAVTLKRIFNS